MENLKALHWKIKELALELSKAKTSTYEHWSVTTRFAVIHNQLIEEVFEIKKLLGIETDDEE